MFPRFPFVSSFCVTDSLPIVSHLNSNIELPTQKPLSSPALYTEKKMIIQESENEESTSEESLQYRWFDM